MFLGITIVLIVAGTALLWTGDMSVAGLDNVSLGLVVLIIGVLAGFISVMLWSSTGELGRPRGRRDPPSPRRRP
jgi:drug/metabolite transporter (DMT)-like permease